MKLYRFFICFLVISSCQKESASLLFSEVNIYKEAQTVIEINMPKAEGNSNVSNKINATLNEFACHALHLDASKEKQVTLDSSIEAFNTSFANFNSLITSELKGELPIWEAFIDGEVIYNNENISCIAMSSSVTTGAANSTMVFQFFNFDAKTGNLFDTKDLVHNMDEFTSLVKKYYDKEINSSFNDADNFINNNAFKLPETLGFSDDGVIILYDNFDVGTFEKEIIEFTIPYEVANDYLNI